MGRQRKDDPRFAGRVEHLEDRRMMTADPLADLAASIEPAAVAAAPPVDQHVLGTPDFWIDTNQQQGGLDDYFGDISQMLAGDSYTGLSSVRTNYGFTGRGQTVAVIDSGIAWDHFALGGGLGQGYRVVGGWDFTEENDANPYDDGPSGSHGTHVSGIIGGSDATNGGVAPGVDLVGLRVFNDSGQGFFSWIENALRWVHENRNSFANPITAINMSLGVSSWNASTVPDWANLEDELAQLKADGIFIAVSAGNSFANFKAAGLSYPASSQYVIPVMSVDGQGNLASYSQRLGRAIAAPGQSIVSTVPDYNGNKNGVTDDFASKSGTSMASPYIAGASVLIRQAMQFVGMTNINEDTIYNHMMATADSFFDSATGQNYKRLNLSRAIDALMPTDDFGSTAATAYNLGTLSGTTSMAGKITKLTDVDCFSFTAGGSGKITFNAACSAGMTPSWQVSGATPLAGGAAGSLSFNVTAGKTYTITLGSSTGMGSYSLSAKLEAAFTFTDWGTVGFNAINDVSVAGERWFRVQAGRSGTLTVLGQFAGSGVSIALYNSDMQQVAGGTTGAGWTRADVTATAGTQYYVKVTGTSNDVDFKLVNLVTQSGTTVTAVGTTGADAFTLTAGATNVLSINGVQYSFAAAASAQFNIDGGAGADSIAFTGSAGNESAALKVGSMAVGGAGFTLSAKNFETQQYVSGGGVDDVSLYDSAGTDTLTARPTSVTLTGTGFSMQVDGAASVTAYSTAAGAGQNDRAYMYGSAGNDRYVGRTTTSSMEGTGFRNVANGFDRVDAYADAGVDQAFLYDSAGDDSLVARPDSVTITGAGYYNVVQGFDRVDTTASLGGRDVASLYDSAGNDVFIARPDNAYLSGSGFYNLVRGFDRVDAYSFAGGLDRAYYYDSAGKDTFVGKSNYGMMTGTGFYNVGWSFEMTYAYATAGGRDVANLYDSAGNDRYDAGPDYGAMTGDNFYNYAQFFEETYAFSTAGGTDSATFGDSAGNDLYTVATTSVSAKTGANVNVANSFKNVKINATAGGVDHVDFKGVVTADAYFGRNGSGTLTRAGSRVETAGLEEIALWLSAGAKPKIDNSALDYIFTKVGG